MKIHQSSQIQLRHRGSTLIISLIILVLLMLLGVTAMRVTNTNLQMAGNIQFADSAMNNAEATIAVAENWLRTGTNYRSAGFMTDSCNGRSVSQLYPLRTTSVPAVPCMQGYTAPANDPLTMSWDDTNSIVGTNTSQRYLIELMSVNDRLTGSNQALGGRSSSGCNQVNTYRITARGTSARGAIKFIQSFFSVLSC